MSRQPQTMELWRAHKDEFTPLVTVHIYLLLHFINNTRSSSPLFIHGDLIKLQASTFCYLLRIVNLIKAYARRASAPTAA